MKLLVIISCAFLVAKGIQAGVSEDLKTCLDNDSISCMQMTMYRTAKSFFEKPTIDIFGGLSLKKTEESGRQGKSIEDNTVAVESAKTIEERNKEIETYLITNAKNFFNQRSLSVNLADTARSIAKRIPDDIKSDIRDLFVEGRAKKRKIMRKIQLLAYGVLAKIAFLAIGALIFLLFVANKALLTSVLALGLSLFTGLGAVAQKSGGGLGGGGGFLSGLGLGNLFGGGGGGAGSVAYSGSGYHSGGGAGWTPYGGSGWQGGGGGWDLHGSYSSPVAQSIAYSGHKQS